MYLRINQNIKLVDLGKLLLPGSTEESLNWDIENVYEWMYVDIPNYDFSLNISRDHGMSEIEDEILDQYEENELHKIVKPGPIYIFAWDRKNDKYINDLSESLIIYLNQKITSDIAVLPGRINVDKADPEPINIYKAKRPER